MNRVLLVFQKNPELGKVKTRLAATVGDETALSIYQKLIVHTKKIIDPINCEKQLWYSNWVELNDIWDPQFYKKYLQKGSDLGERMSNGFKETLLDESTVKAVIIGTDCAELTTGIIEEAFNALENYDFVIGPAKDGGYYLLGMNSYYPNVFEGVEWSTATVCNTTIEKIKSLNKGVYLLPPLSDVDNEEDWNNVKNLIEI